MMAARKAHQDQKGRISRVKGFPEDAAAGQPPETGKDYLVIYEEQDPDGLPTDDHLVLDIEAPQRHRGEMDVQQKLDIGLTNTTSRLGTLGFAMSVLGALGSAAIMVTFAAVYPTGWYDRVGNIHVSLVRTMILLSVICLLVMVLGTILTHYGRRVKARGELRDVRIVEKEMQSSVAFE